MTSPTNLFRLPFAEDVSAGQRFEALARQAAASAADINLPTRARLTFHAERDRLETLAALADADMILAACAEGELA
jgi:hypothetical protein